MAEAVCSLVGAVYSLAAALYSLAGAPYAEESLSYAREWMTDSPEWVSRSKAGKDAAVAETAFSRSPAAVSSSDRPNRPVDGFSEQAKCLNSEMTLVREPLLAPKSRESLPVDRLQADYARGTHEPVRNMPISV